MRLPPCCPEQAPRSIDSMGELPAASLEILRIVGRLLRSANQFFVTLTLVTHGKHDNQQPAAVSSSRQYVTNSIVVAYLFSS